MKRVIALVWVLLPVLAPTQQLQVGSKKFTESYVLAEIARRLLVDLGYDVAHREGMGATSIVWAALKSGDIDVYPEYTGTITDEILKMPHLSRGELSEELAKVGVGVTGDLGFNNTYALVMKRRKAEQMGISKVSDLVKHPNLRAGPTHEFLSRQDGWKPLMSKYRVKLNSVRGVEHTLGYAALNSGEIDLKDSYSTDAEIRRYDLKVLEDDLGFFPQYKGVYLYRLSLPTNAIAALKGVEGAIDEELMIRLNDEAAQSKNYEQAAALFFSDRGKEAQVEEKTASERILPRLWEHLRLVGISMALAIAVGIPLGIWAAGRKIVGSAILGVAGIVQTIPSLALLALLVPLPGFGIQDRTAITALFLYSLLPIIRNTAVGLQAIPAGIRESAEALGLEPLSRLYKIYIPMASRTILAGVKTSAIINIGTATLAALIGAGGLGQPIISGLAINDTSLILEGALPAALLALLAQLLFDAFDALFIPRGLRLETK